MTTERLYCDEPDCERPVASGVVWGDDKQVNQGVSKKDFAATGSPPFCRVTVAPCGHEEHARRLAEAWKRKPLVGRSGTLKVGRRRVAVNFIVEPKVKNIRERIRQLATEGVYR